MPYAEYAKRALRAMRWMPVAALLALAFAAPANALDPSLTCNFQLATAGGQALTCPQGGIRNVVDIEGGTAVYENGALDRGKLRLNLSGGETVDHTTGKLVREGIALNPDVGGCTLIYDGRKTLTASFCPQGFGEQSGIRFHWRPTMLSGLKVCDHRGCLDVATELRRRSPKSPQPSGTSERRAQRRIAQLTRSVKRLEQRVARISHATRRR
jgi:hypothetical protein